MFILFGFGKRTVKDFGGREEIKCRRCNNKKSWHYKKITTWFTLFFVPVIPYKTEYIRVCPICNEHDPLKKEAFNAHVSGDEVIVDVEGSYTGKTDTQANYMREMAAIKAEKEGSTDA